jgi:hypothetical protein
MNYDDFFADAVMRLHDEGRYRVFPVSSGLPGAIPVVLSGT